MQPTLAFAATIRKAVVHPEQQDVPELMAALEAAWTYLGGLLFFFERLLRWKLSSHDRGPEVRHRSGSFE